MMKLRTLATLMTLSVCTLHADQDPRLALAQDVIQAMHADKMFDRMSAQMQQMMMASVPTSGTPEQQARAKEFQAKVMALSMESAKGMLAKMDVIYAEVYTEAELKAMKAFYTSPEGQSVMEKQPQIMQRMMPLIQQVQRDLMPKIQQLIKEEQAASSDAEEGNAPGQPSATAPVPPPAAQKPPQS